MPQGTAIPYEASTRLAVFVVCLCLLLLWERLAGRTIGPSHRARWFANYGLGLVDTALVRLVFPAGAVGSAIFAEHQGWGALRQFGTPAWANACITIFLLDLTVYLQHRLLHVWPWLWRVHRVHHADPEIDVSTALRFHPLEILLSMLLKVAVAMSFGLSAAAVLAFEILLNAAAMFNHASVDLPAWLERAVRVFLVTPAMHRVHHSTLRADANCNFGFSVSCWDRLFGTYRASSVRSPPALGYPDGPPTSGHVRLPALLAMPFDGSR